MIQVHDYATSAGRVHTFLDRCLRPFENAAVVLAAIILLCAMFLVAFDALLRYAFNAPLVFQYTLTEEYLLVALITLAMPWGYRTGGYIRITGAADKLPAAARNGVFRGGLLISFAYVAVLAWTGGNQFLKVYQSGEARIGIIDWPVWLSWIWIPIGCGLLALRLLLTALGPASELHVEHDPVEEI